jgi:ribosomal protein L31
MLTKTSNSAVSSSAVFIAHSYASRKKESELSELALTQYFELLGCDVERGDTEDERNPDLVVRLADGERIAIEVKTAQTPIYTDFLKKQTIERTGKPVDKFHQVLIASQHFEHYKQWQDNTGIKVYVVYGISWLPEFWYVASLDELAEHIIAEKQDRHSTIRGTETDKVYFDISRFVPLRSDDWRELLNAATVNLIDAEAVAVECAKAYGKIYYPDYLIDAQGAAESLADKMSRRYKSEWKAVKAKVVRH